DRAGCQRGLGAFAPGCGAGTCSALAPARLLARPRRVRRCTGEQRRGMPRSLETLPLGHLVIAARIIMHRAVVVAGGGTIGGGERGGGQQTFHKMVSTGALTICASDYCRRPALMWRNPGEIAAIGFVDGVGSCPSASSALNAVTHVCDTLW